MTIAPFPVPPIVKSVTVCAAPARAFERFARWPLAQVHTGPDPVECAIEPRVGGRGFERAADGREALWGTCWLTTRPIALLFPGPSSWRLRQFHCNLRRGGK
jgi:hypothetical protein